jgi:hypothetical protein
MCQAGRASGIIVLMVEAVTAGPPVADPTDTERLLWAAFGRGELVDVRTGDEMADDPWRAESWGPSRRVRAEVVAALLLGAVEPAAGHVALLRLAGGLVEGTIDLRGGTVDCAVEMTGCRLGTLRLDEARTRTIDLSGSVLEDIGASATEVGGNLILRRCRARTISLGIAHIVGRLSLSSATLANRGGRALSGDGLTVDGGMFCQEGFQAEGEVRLPDAHIGQLLLNSAKLANPGGYALYGDRLTVDGGIFCRGGFQAEGVVQLGGAHIDGQLSLNGAKLANPGGYALNGDGLTVDGDMFCEGGFQAEGVVRLGGAHITGQIGLSGASLSSAGLALDCETLQARSLWLNNTTVTGVVDLSGAQLNTLYDDQARPFEMHIDGFTYESLKPYAKARTAAGRLAWLARAESDYRPQPYEQLAAYYRRLGHDEEARHVLLAKQRRRRTTLGLGGKVIGYLLDGIVGYGYRPSRAFTWLVVLLAAGSLYFTFNRPASLDPAMHPHYQPVLYTAELLIPIVNLGQSNWAPAGASQWISVALIGLGWILVTAVVAGVTRVLTRV